MNNTIQEQKVQIILLTGYLGAGKTTLLNFILKSQNQFKIAVIQNEYADEMGIESPLVKGPDGKPFDKFYELPNGCICCTAKGELLLAIEYFIKSEHRLDYILIETNGLADPSSVIFKLNKVLQDNIQFWVDKQLGFPAELRLVSAVVSVPRVKELMGNLIFQKQLIFADTILMNQIDKSNKNEIQECEDLIKILNPNAPLLRTSYCIIPLEQLFTIPPKKILQSENEGLLKSIHSNELIQQAFFKVDIDYDLHQWERNVGMILWESDFKIIRVKGICRVRNDEFAYSIQGINDTFEIQKTDTKFNAIQDNLSKLLFIGENLNKELLFTMLTTPI